MEQKCVFFGSIWSRALSENVIVFDLSTPLPFVEKSMHTMALKNDRTTAVRTTVKALQYVIPGRCLVGAW